MTLQPIDASYFSSLYFIVTTSLLILLFIRYAWRVYVQRSAPASLLDMF